MVETLPGHETVPSCTKNLRRPDLGRHGGATAKEGHQRFGDDRLLLDRSGVSPGKDDSNDCKESHPPHQARIVPDHLVNIVHFGPLAQFKENSL